MSSGLNRRDALKLGMLGSAALVLPLERAVGAKNGSDRIAASKLPKPFTVPFTEPPVLDPIHRSGTTDYYSITMRANAVEILPGFKTQIWGYDGVPSGPTIKATRGCPAVVRQINNLPPSTRCSATKRGPRCTCTAPDRCPSTTGTPTTSRVRGSTRTTSTRTTRTLWCHDHGMHHTAENVYMGLPAMYTMTDQLEQSLPIPHGRYDVPIILRDALFTPKGEFLFDDKSHSGLYGDVILVNGRPWPVMKVERRKYRFRLNAAVARGFRLMLDTGYPMTVIATDGGLMAAPAPTRELRLAMAERYEVVIDFAKYRIGQRVTLNNLGVKNSTDFDHTGKVMAFDVVSESADSSNNAIPDLLNPDAPSMLVDQALAKHTRKFQFIRKNGMWTINGRTWSEAQKSGYEYVRADPALGDIEIWEFENTYGGWLHPVHVHLVDFKILDRNGKAPFNYEAGPKDVVHLGENETVRVLAQFGPHVGRYMIHCHNLSHEDHDMMAQFRVGPASYGYDPVKASPCKDLPEVDMDMEY